MTTPRDPRSGRKPLTPRNVFFHILLSEDTWRFAVGITLAVVLAPVLAPFDRTGIGRYVMFITVVVIGWAVAKHPSRWFVRRIRQRFPNR